MAVQTHRWNEDVEKVLANVRAAMAGKLAYAEPIETDDLTIIPAARVSGGGGGGGGGGEGDQGEGEGGGAGFGLNVRPVGAFVIQGDEVNWKPVVDVNRVITGSQVLAITAVICGALVLRGALS